MTPSRTPYPSDGSDDEWAFVAPYLTLLPEDAGQRTYDLREVFNACFFSRARREGSRRERTTSSARRGALPMKIDVVRFCGTGK